MDESRGMPPIFGFLGKVTAKGKKALINSIVLLILNLIFIIGCAFAFVSIENNQNFRNRTLSKFLQAQDDLYYFLSQDYNSSTSPDKFPNHLPDHTGWEPAGDLWGELKAAHSSRCFKLDNAHTQANLWNFWSSFDFCATVLTTIGYGSMSPRTRTGKWFCLIYSIVGIPIMAMYLALFSKGICAYVTTTINLFSTFMAKVNKSFKLSDLVSRVVSLVFLLLGLVVFVCMWSAILNNTNEADSFVKCVYFYIITLTTVGLGDISMTEAQPFVLIRVLFLFCVGLTLVTSVFNALRSVSAAHTRMLKAQGRKLTNKAQEVVMNTKLRANQNGDGQLDPLTTQEDIELTDGPAIVETTFADENEGYNSRDYHRFNNGDR